MSIIIDQSTSKKLEDMSVYIDPNVFIQQHLQLYSFAKVYKGVQINSSSLGSYSYVSIGSQILNCTIGSYCSVGNLVSIGFPEHPTQWLTSHPFPFMNYLPSEAHWRLTTPHDFSSQEICIGNDVWIGAKSIIMGGVKVSDGAIVAAGSVVTRDVPCYSIVGG